MKLRVYRQERFELECDCIAPDKSISHRAVIFSFLSDKPSFVRNYLKAEDTLDTLRISKMLGMSVDDAGSSIMLTPPSVIQEPNDILYCGNSGTSIRLYLGLLSSQKGVFVLSGDKYLHKRPMGRVIKPLLDIGANIFGRESNTLAPVIVFGNRNLKSFNYKSQISSAQVKSAMILASLFTDGACTYSESELSRDHTEKMLSKMGAEIESKYISNEYIVTINPLRDKLQPIDMNIPSDPSSAFFIAIAAAIIPNSRCVLKNVLLNKTRIESFLVLERMGVSVRFINVVDSYDLVGDIEVISPSKLKCVDVSCNIPWLIDEIPALAIAMSVAEGVSSISNAKELRVKESDRISTVVCNLRQCGIEVLESDDGFIITGGKPRFGSIDSYGDHRIAMAFAILGLISGIEIQNADCINTSFPNFINILEQITRIDYESETGK